MKIARNEKTNISCSVPMLVTLNRFLLTPYCLLPTVFSLLPTPCIFIASLSSPYTPSPLAVP
ncbi:MAG: hypothetical protein FJ217_16895, partial [Ignavibacteria bacterium]|nr:hypothetical protein [Ignavibacteria bacterium]